MTEEPILRNIPVPIPKDSSDPYEYIDISRPVFYSSFSDIDSDADTDAEEERLYTFEGEGRGSGQGNGSSSAGASGRVGLRRKYRKQKNYKGWGPEASWIQEGLDRVGQEDFEDVHPYHNARALENVSAFNGFGQQLGDTSNLGFDSFSHKDYFTQGNAQEDFHDKIERLIDDNYNYV